MSAAVPASAILKALIGTGAVPDSAQLPPRQDSALWEDEDRQLRYRFQLTRGSRGALHWQLDVFDGTSLGLTPAEGGFSVRVMVVQAGRRQNATALPWPEGAKEARARAEELAPLVRAGLALVPDRAALARLLLEREDVVRPPVEVSLFQGYPVRLVLALVSARALDDAALEREVLGGRLGRGRRTRGRSRPSWKPVTWVSP